MLTRLKIEHLEMIKGLFERLDKDSKGILKSEHILKLIQVKNGSLLSLYSTHFYNLIPKKDPKGINFFEFIKFSMDFCLANEEKILKFVFRLIDEDNNEVLTRKDIYRLLTKRYNKKLVFPVNAIKIGNGNQVENIEIEDEEIDFNKFKDFHEKVPIIIYPAFRLQEKMKEQILGKRFWQGLYNRMVEKDMQKSKEQQQENLLQNIEEGRELKFIKNKALFQKIKDRKVMSDASRIVDCSMRNIFERNPRKRNSDLFMKNKNYFIETIADRRSTRSPENIYFECVSRAKKTKNIANKNFRN